MLCLIPVNSWVVFALQKNPISSSRPLVAWELSRLPRFAYNAFPGQGHSQTRCLCPWPSVSPGASPPGRCGGRTDRQPPGGVRPAPPGRGTLLCAGRVVSDQLPLGSGNRAKSAEKTAGSGDGTGDNIHLQPLASNRPGTASLPVPGSDARCHSRPLSCWLQLT